MLSLGLGFIVFDLNFSIVKGYLWMWIDIMYEVLYWVFKGL